MYEVRLGAATTRTSHVHQMPTVVILISGSVEVLGASTATEWQELVAGACGELRIGCQMSGSGYGPSDQMSFYTKGIPVLHFFTGSHGDYHKSSDDWPLVNAAARFGVPPRGTTSTSSTLTPLRVSMRRRRVVLPSRRSLTASFLPRRSA